MSNEVNLLLCNKKWTLVDLPAGYKPIKCKGLFRTKYNIEGSIQT